MTTIRLIGHVAPPPPRLSGKEIEAINSLTNDVQQLEIFRRRAANLIANSSSKIEDLYHKSQSIILDLCGFVEAEFRKYGDIIDDKYYQVSPIFLRSMYLPQTRVFLARMFGQRQMHRADVLMNEVSVADVNLCDFVFSGFCEFIRIKNAAQSIPSLEDVLLEVWRSKTNAHGNYVDWRRRYDDEKSPTHTYLKRAEKERYQVVCSATPKRDGNYINIAESGVDVVKYEVVDCDGLELKLFQYYRDITLKAHYNATLSEFIRFWDRKLFIEKIGASEDQHISVSGVEHYIYSDIIRSDLVSDFTGGEEGYGASAYSRLSARDRLSLIDQYTANHPGAPVSDFVVELFPSILDELNPATPLPTMAPEIWPDDRQTIEGQKETPPAFIKRVYGEWEGRGLTKKLIRSLDPTLYRALYNWLRQPGNVMPPDLDLPTIEEQNDRVFEALKRDHGSDDALSHTAREAAREANRIRMAVSRRAKGDGRDE
jgi:hypothetical protein